MMNLQRTTLCSTLALALVGCGPPETAREPLVGDGKADNPNQQSLAGQFVTTTAPLDDGCGMGFELDGGELVDLVVSEDGTSFVLETDGDDVSCSLGEAGAFECEVEVPPSPLLANVSISMSGQLDGSDRFDAVMSTSVECEGAECEELSVIFDGAELPCTSTASVVGTRARADDFEVQVGGYAIAVSPPVEGPSTCQMDTLGALPEVVAVETNEDGFTLDDGLGPFECFLDQGGAIDCERVVEVPGLEFRSVAVGAFVDDGAATGALQVEVGCIGSDEECAMAEQLFGELPCTAYHTLELELAAD